MQAQCSASGGGSTAPVVCATVLPPVVASPLVEVEATVVVEVMVVLESVAVVGVSEVVSGLEVPWVLAVPVLVGSVVTLPEVAEVAEVVPSLWELESEPPQAAPARMSDNDRFRFNFVVMGYKLLRVRSRSGSRYMPDLSCR